MSFPMLVPREVLAEFNSTGSVSDEKMMLKVWQSLASLDVDALQSDELENTCQYWSNTLTSVRFALYTKATNLSMEMLCMLYKCAENAVKLALKCQSFEPVFCFIGVSTDFGGDVALVSEYPVKTVGFESSPLANMMNMVLDHIKISEVQTVTEIIMRFVVYIMKVPIDSELFDYVEPLQLRICSLTQEEFDSARKSDDKKLPEGLGKRDSPKFAQFEKEFLVHFGLSSVFMNHDWLDHTEYDPREFVEVRCPWFVEDVECDFTIDVDQFAIYCVMGALKRSVDSYSKEKLNNAKVASMCMYAMYMDMKTPFMRQFFTMSFSEEIENEVEKFRDRFNLVQDVGMLIEKTESVTAAKSLLMFPECRSSLRVEHRLHNLLHILLSDSVSTDDIQVDEFGTAMLFRAMSLKQEISKECIYKLLINIKEAALKIDNSGFALIDCSVENGTTTQLVLPECAAEFLTEKAPDVSEICVVMCLMLLRCENFVSQDYMNLFAELSLHWNLNGAYRGILYDHLVKKMPSEFANVRSTLMYARVRDMLVVETREATLAKLTSVTNISVIAMFLDVLIQENDRKSVLSVYNSNADKMDMVVAKMSPESQVFVVSLLIVESSDHAVSLIKRCASTIGDGIFEVLGKYALEKTKLVQAIFDNIKATARDANIMFDNLPAIPEQLTSDFLALLSGILENSFPVVKYTPSEKFAPRTVMDVSWDSAAESETADGDIDLYATPDIRECNGKTDHFFHCWSCSAHPICLSCALQCHAGHNLTHMGNETHDCACGNKCTKGKNISVPERPRTVKVGPRRQAYSNASLISLFEQISKSSIIEKKSVGIENKLSVPISEWEMKNMPCQTKPVVKFQNFGEVPRLIDMSRVSYQNNRSHVERRMNVAPVQLICKAGPSEDLLVVCSGQTLVAYTMDYEEVARYQAPYTGFQLATCPCDSSLFAFVGLHNVNIMTITKEDGFHIVQGIELMLELLGGHLFVDYVKWVPNTPEYLAVVCNGFVKIYDVPCDCFSPCACFMLDDDTYFTSSVFGVNNETETPIALMALSSGRIARDVLDFGQFDGPMPLKEFIKFDTEIPREPVISACDESGLMFISARNAGLTICKLSDALHSTNPIPTVSVDIPVQTPWVFTCNIGPAHFFVNPMSGTVMAVNITDQAFEISMIGKSAGSSVPLAENRMTHMSILNIGNDIFGISGSTGRQMILVPNDCDSVDQDDSDTEEFQSEGGAIDVPATFWTRSRISTEKIFMRGIDGDHEMHDCSGLMSGRRWIFFSQLPHKVMEIKSLDENQVIVGLKICVGSNSPWIKVNGRSHSVNKERGYMLPLRPEEIGRMVKVELGSNGGCDINCDRVDVYVIDKDRLHIGASVDWMNDATSVFDFVDGKISTKDMPKIDHIMATITTILSQNDSEDLSPESTAFLVSTMYTRPVLADSCRRALAKCVKNREQGTTIWAKTISQLVTDKQVHPTSWPLLWRDISLLPEHLFNTITDQIWASSPEFTGTHTIISAFLSK